MAYGSHVAASGLIGVLCILQPLILATSSSGAEPAAACIVLPSDPSPLEELAARETRRYIYLRTGSLLPKVRTDTLPQDMELVVIARHGRKLVNHVAAGPDLGSEGYRLKTIRQRDRRVLYAGGGDDLGTLYAAYRLAEVFGVRFYLHGDCIPDRRAEVMIPDLDEESRPLFALRGILPFHDFPEGPDWWNADEYLAVIGQLPRLRMNFIGLHNYPEGRKEFRTEPGVWIGQPADIGRRGKVRFSYPAAYHNTLRGTWGYEPRASTAEFACGASLLFEHEVFGSEISCRHAPLPKTARQCNEVFERTGALLNEGFSFAQRLGIKTCIGTEIPMRIPKEVRDRLQKQGKHANDPAVVQTLYEGAFRRIAQTYPLDYYWFWTPESWTWEGANQAQVSASTNDLALAFSAWTNVRAPFQLATCGWVLGPSHDRALFDSVLPRHAAISCISRRNGLDPLDEGFLRIRNRDKWAIPWLEDDGDFMSAQLWVGRMRRDAVDAMEAGCAGLLGIHWRTRVIAPNIAALAQAAWRQEPWKRIISANERASAPTGRWTLGPCQAADDFFNDWARHEFGEKAGPDVALLFSQLDGQLPRSSDWVRDGPGGLAPDPQPWEVVSARYAFVDRLHALRPAVEGAGNLARFDYWVHTFEFMQACARVRCTWAEYNRSISLAKAATDKHACSQLAREQALPLRRRLVAEISELYQHLLATVSTTGEMGTVANLEARTLPELLFRPGRQLELLLGDKLPADAVLPGRYRGETRVIIPALRGNVAQGMPLKLKVIVLGESAPATAHLFWRKLGTGQFQRFALAHVARGVYSATLPARALGGVEAIEYYVRVKDRKGTITVYPPTAPALSQSVVVLPW